MTLNLNADSIGQRIAITLALLMLAANTLTDDLCRERPEPVTSDQCADFCRADGLKVKRWESWACECAP